jgi:tetratricopeptide (TPR) repeat protein
MKWATALIFLLMMLGRSVTCPAQEPGQASDPTQLAFTKAMRDGRLADAEKLLIEAISKLEQSDPNSPRLSDYLRKLALLLDMRGNHSDAVALLEHAIEIDRSAFGPSNLRITNDLVRMASYSRMQGNLQEAEQLLNQALEIERANEGQLKSGSDVSLAAGVLGSVASVYMDEHRWTEAEALMLEESKLCDNFEEPYRAGYALCGSLPGRLAEVYSAEGRAVDAEQLGLDKGRPPELVALNKIAEKYANDGLYPSAEDAYNRAIALAEKIEADPKSRYGGLIVDEMNSLGQLFQKEGFKDRAEKTYLSALEIDEERAGAQPNSKGYAKMLNPHYLIDLYRSEGRLKNAEPLLQRVLAIQEQSLGEHHQIVARTITTLANVYEVEAKYAQALPLYERALAIQQANLGPDHPRLIGPLSDYAEILRKLHRDAEAAQVQEQIDTISRARQN